MDQLESALAPITILPSQLYGPPLGGARTQPEKRLQLAVLADALVTFHRSAGQPRARARRLFAEAEAWFASDATDGPFSFLSICQSLDLDPDYIRRGLRAPGAARRKIVLVRRDSTGMRHKIVSRMRRVA